MLMPILSKFKKAVSNSKGSVTLEAAIIFPTIMFILFCLIFFSMYIYEKLVVIDSATYAATQTAATWDNTRKNPETGSINGNYDYDNLYWRLLEYFGYGVNTKIEKSQDYLTDRLNTGVFKVSGRNGKPITYQKGMLTSTVSVNINENLIMPAPWLENVLKTNVEARAQAQVTDPVEYIRTIDVTEKYVNEIKDGLIGKFKGFIDKFIKPKDSE